MNRKSQIIDFAGMQFGNSRRVQLPRNHNWKVRRQVKNRLGVARNLRTVFGNILGLF